MKRTITHLSVVAGPSGGIRIAVFMAVISSMFFGCGPSDPIAEVRQQIARGELEESLEPLQELIEEDPSNPVLLFLYGQVLLKTGQPGLAEWPLRKVMENPEWFERAAMLIAKTEHSAGNSENAAEIYAEVLARNPDNMTARIRRAMACAASPQLYDEALAEVDRILEIDPTELGAFKPRILAYLGMNKPKEAGEALEELGARIDEDQPDDNPIRGWHCATMAIFASESGDEELAVKRWAECEEKYPIHENVVSAAVDFHKRRGEMERALEIAQAANEAATEDGSGGYRLMVAELLRSQDRPEEAEAVLLEGADQAEGAVEQAAALLALTEHYKFVGQTQSAAETLERALKISRTIGPQPDLLFSLADLWILAGKPDRALELSAQMSVPAHRVLVRARVAHDRKEYAKALQLYNEATRIWPENPYAAYHAGRAAMAIGQFDRAFDSFLLATRIDDGATDARMQAARLLAAEGRFSTALEMLSTTRSAHSLASQLFGIELQARLQGGTAGLKSASAMSKNLPAHFGEAVEIVAMSVRLRDDGGQPWKIVENFVSLEFTPANHIPVLRAAVRFAPGETELATLKPLVERAVQKHPDSAEVMEIEGMYLERIGRTDEAAKSYRRASDAEPPRETALLRLARLEAEADPAGATGLLERALGDSADSEQRLDTELLLEVVSKLPNSPETESLLERALEREPADGRIALQLATVLEANGAAPERIVRLANRAIRFQVGDLAVALRDRAKQNI